MRSKTGLQPQHLMPGLWKAQRGCDSPVDEPQEGHEEGLQHEAGGVRRVEACTRFGVPTVWLLYVLQSHKIKEYKFKIHFGYANVNDFKFLCFVLGMAFDVRASGSLRLWGWSSPTQMVSELERIQKPLGSDRQCRGSEREFCVCVCARVLWGITWTPFV